MRRIFKISATCFFVLIVLFAGCAPRWVTNYEGQVEEKPVVQKPGNESRKKTKVITRRGGNNSLVDEKKFEKFRVEIQRFWGAPYVWGGASPKGTDCSGMIKTIYSRALNMNLPHSTRLLYKKGKPVPVDELKMGDLIFFGDGRSLTPTHVGIFIEKGIFLHASVSKGVTLSRLAKSPYNRLYIGARRLLD